MTSRAARTVLRLDPAGRHWVRLPLSSLNLARHGRPPPPPPPPPGTTRFETLASETTPVPSIQAVPPPTTASGHGTRTGTPKAGAVPVPAAGTPALAQETRFRGIKVPRKPPPPAEGGPFPERGFSSSCRIFRLMALTSETRPPPPRALPPAPAAECCMSGCATCVYDLYLDDLEHFHAQVRDAKRQILEALRAESAKGASGGGGTVDLSGWPERELGPPPTVADLQSDDQADQGPGPNPNLTTAGAEGVDPAEAAEREAAAARRQVSDPTLRAFLEMEARMKKKQQGRAQRAAEA